MRVYERVLRPLLQGLDPERSHTLTIRILSLAQGISPLRRLAGLCSYQDDRLAFTWRGLNFRNPVGLAAGVDKDARAMRSFEALGLGFIEVGTVTPEAQPGNPRPRVFRLPARKALVNSLGFPGQGARRIAGRLAVLRPSVPLGVNIGMNAQTPLDDAAGDYLTCLDLLYPHADYFVVNVSSPNTAGLTGLQARSALASLTGALKDRRAALSDALGQSPKPLLVKISPDLTRGELDDVLEVAVANGVDGIVAVNTSVDPELKGEQSSLSGGISGEPLRQRALETVGYARRHAPEDFFIVGVGGVSDERDAWALLRAGANAVQLYTALVYRGPCVVKSINRGLVSLLEGAELPSIRTLAAP